MTTSDGADFGFAAAILVMVASTYLCRTGGFWLMGRVPLTPRIRKMLEALPGSVIAATVLPIAIKGGGPAILAIVTTAGLMILRRNELLAIAGGLIVAALARALDF